ncbi:septum formation initiator family protein [Tistrella mobilis]|uniref:FtsB family cell division protein n=1 Tax=Tistrella mobilis TaxID=171437 RepID=UPI003558BA09
MRQIAPQIFWGCLVSYFAFHAVQGDRGVVAWLQMRQQLAALDHQLDDARTERQRLEKQVALMRAESLDPDMLDEQVRRVLGYTDARDRVEFYDAAAPVTPDASSEPPASGAAGSGTPSVLDVLPEAPR